MNVILSVDLDVEIHFPKVNLKLPSGVLLKSFCAVVDDGANNGGGCAHCAFNQSRLCRHVDCYPYIYVPVLDTPCL